MAYCRKDATKSDISVYVSSEGCLVCAHCSLRPTQPGKFNNDFEVQKFTEMISHVQDHLNRGHKVPDNLIAKLEKDKLEMGNILTPPGQKRAANTHRSRDLRKGKS